MLRSELRDLVALPGRARKLRRLQRKRLRGRIPLAGNIAFRYRPLLHAEDGFSRSAIQNKHQAGLARLDQRRDLLAVLDHVDQRRLRRQIGVPKVVMHGLQIPLHFSRHGIHGDQRVAEQVRAGTVPAVAIVAGPADRHQQRAGLRVHGKRAPDIYAGAVLPAVVEPGLMPGFARLRNRVERPHQLPGSRIPGANIAAPAHRSRCPAGAIR